jgi:hypothetical protein
MVARRARPDDEHGAFSYAIMLSSMHHLQALDDAHGGACDEH